MEYDCIIVRFDEIGLKASHTKSNFIDILTSHIKKVVPDSKISVLPYRVLVRCKDMVKSAKKISGIIGVSSASPAIICEKNIESINKTAFSLFEKGKTFRVSCQRSDKDFELNSQEVCVKVGAYISSKGGKVSLENYSQNIQIDFFGDKCFVFRDKFMGIGGLPVSTQGRALCIIKNKRDYLSCLMVMARGILPVLSGNEKLCNKMIKKVTYAKIRYCKDIAGLHGNFEAVISGNKFGKWVKGFDCPVFYPLCLADENYFSQKFNTLM